MKSTLTSDSHAPLHGEGGYTPDEPTLSELRELLKGARYLSAWRLAEPLAPLQAWAGCEARHLAARLARGLGSPRLGRILHLLNARRFPANEEVFLAGILRQLSQRGPMEVLDRVDARLARADEIGLEHRADLLGVKAWIHARLHDFEPAHRAVDEAISLVPDRAWLHVQRSCVLEIEDRYEEALRVAREAVRLAPHHPSAVLQAVDCLIHLGSDDEAIMLLEGEHDRGEMAVYAERLVNLFSERDDHQRALHFLDEHDRRSPLLDKTGKAWSDRRRADMLYLAGDFEGCLNFSDQAGDGFHRNIAAKMREPGALTKGRKRLRVTFVRQYEMTCAPATLAALADYWGIPCDHLAIADAICYDGTPWHKERLWAEANGFHAAEFRLTHEILVALIDRGVPFTLTTEAVTSGHLQACIGYDDRQGTVLLRDPTERHYGETILDGLIEDHPVQGPRCMLLLPEAEMARIADLTLPDAAVYDAGHRLSLALDAHDRQTARSVVDAMPDDHPMTRWAELRLAGYDRNPVAEFRAIDPLVARFPENASLRFIRLGVLQRMHDLEREREMLTAELQREGCDPVFYSEMGELLSRDARQLTLADHYLRKAVRLRRTTARAYASLAYCRWKERRFEDSGRYRRVASCLNSTWEPYAAAYTEICRAIARPAEGLAFLRKRVESLGGKSAGPWQTLAEELDAQGQTAEAMAVLDHGLTVRPDDGELMLTAGRLLAGWGEKERGERLMKGARGKVREAEWQREMAKICAFFGQRDEAIRHWQELLHREPYSVDAYRAMARLLAEEGGRTKANGFLAEATTRHPHIPALWSLRAEWEALLGPGEAIPSLEKALSLDPDYIWVIRELALQRMRTGEGEGALAAAHEGLRKDPHSPGSHGIFASILEDLSRFEEARNSFQAAIRLDVDYTFASQGLLRIAPDVPSKLAALRFIESEMRRQVSDGSIVPEYRDMAYRFLEPETLLEQLRGFCEERPDLWQTWAARGEQARDMELMDEAFRCARELTERFPLLPRAWLEMARTHHAAGEYEEEIETLGRAVNLSPAWGWAARELSDALERMGRYDEAQAVLERNLHHEPLAGESHGYLADLLWKRGRRADAFDHLLRGMRDCPSYTWGWNTLAAWSRDLKRENEVVSAMEAHGGSRAHIVEWWTLSADVLGNLERTEEALEVIETGLKRHLGDTDLLEKKAAMLAALHRFDQALTACSEGLQIAPTARNLRGRQAFVLMQSGKPNEAIRQMSALVEEHPDYLWAIRQLAGWLSRRTRWEELRDLSRKWVRQNPQAPQAHGYLGEAEKALSNRPAAKTELGKAFALDPEYSYAGRNLLSYQIEDREFDAAEQTLRTLEHYASSAEITADAVELAVSRKDRDEAKRRAQELLLRDDSAVSLLNWMKDLFTNAGWAGDWWTMLDTEGQHSHKPSKPVLEAWIRSLPARGKSRQAARRLESFPADQEDLAASGWVALLDTADAKKDAGQARKWIRKHRDWFRSRTDLWAAAGNTFTNIQDHKAAAAWFQDWKERGHDVPCDALFNCGVAFQEVSGWREAAEVREVALRRYPTHSLSTALRAMVTLQTALNTGVLSARAFGAEVEPGKLTKYYSGCFSLYRSLDAAEDENFDSAAARYREACATLNQFNYDRGVAGFFEETAQRLATRVPWAKGRAAKIRRKWGRYTGVSGWRGLSWWKIGLIIYLLLHFLNAWLRSF